ncbi:hypothetical protein [Formosa sp. L2A11]|uniref:hypothetical protein n=1 Tax=Formosa sp. L2A11 TaxID=2686363 RepID=UPI00131E6357|nr:hypothetical protein [Formosa sp. L2A11]
MFGAIPMAMYKLDRTDTISPKSLSGMSAVYTTNSSYFISFFNKWYYKEDTWKGKFFVMTGDKNSQFYMTDNKLHGFYDYGIEVTLVSIGVQIKIIDNLYGGVTYTLESLS